MSHIRQTEGYLFCKELREAYELPCVLIIEIGCVVSMAVFWGISIYRGGMFWFFAILSVFIVCMMVAVWVRYKRIYPIVHSRWFIDDEQIIIKISNRTACVRLHDITYAVSYEMRYYIGKGSITQSFIILSNAPLDEQSMPENFFKVLGNGVGKGWVFLPANCDIMNCLASNRSLVSCLHIPN